MELAGPFESCSSAFEVGQGLPFSFRARLSLGAYRPGSPDFTHELQRNATPIRVVFTTHGARPLLNTWSVRSRAKGETAAAKIPYEYYSVGRPWTAKGSNTSISSSMEWTFWQSSRNRTVLGPAAMVQGSVSCSQHVCGHGNNACWVGVFSFRSCLLLLNSAHTWPSASSLLFMQARNRLLNRAQAGNGRPDNWPTSSNATRPFMWYNTTTKPQI